MSMRKPKPHSTRHRKAAHEKGQERMRALVNRCLKTGSVAQLPNTSIPELIERGAVNLYKRDLINGEEYKAAKAAAQQIREEAEKALAAP